MHRPLSGPPPRLAVPPGACDTHIHIYDPQPVAGAATPADATVENYRRIMTWLGHQRVVVVQPNAYRDDNRCTLKAVADLGPDKARAIVVIKPSIGDIELRRLHDAGARGVRVMCLPGGFTQWDTMESTLARITPLGWHCIVQFDGREFAEREAQLKRIPGNYIIDHTGKFLEPVATDSAALKALLRLLERGNCYVKLSGPYETSRTGAPAYADVTAIARAIAAHAPERLLWATNWPHNGYTGAAYPSDVAMLDRLLDIVPDAHHRHLTLVDNPARLYGF